MIKGNRENVQYKIFMDVDPDPSTLSLVTGHPSPVKHLREAFLSIKFKNLFCNTEVAVFKYSTE